MIHSIINNNANTNDEYNKITNGGNTNIYK